jgi:hypothetical protein
VSKSSANSTSPRGDRLATCPSFLSKTNTLPEDRTKNPGEQTRRGIS